MFLAADAWRDYMHIGIHSRQHYYPIRLLAALKFKETWFLEFDAWMEFNGRNSRPNFCYRMQQIAVWSQAPYYTLKSLPPLLPTKQLSNICCCFQQAGTWPSLVITVINCAEELVVRSWHWVKSCVGLVEHSLESLNYIFTIVPECDSMSNKTNKDPKAPHTPSLNNIFLHE